MTEHNELAQDLTNPQISRPQFSTILKPVAPLKAQTFGAPLV
ncbi:MAG TPA: hypothetical protein VF681_07305 [Abditibacteriaceae bacterium]|jgi:hypothetical protein